MKCEKQSTCWRLHGMSLIVVLGLLLSACGTPASNPIGSVTATGAPVTNRPSTSAPPSPTAPPTQSMERPTLASAGLMATPATVAAEQSPLNCEANQPLTPAQTEGPYYTPNSPERTSLIGPGMSGTKLIVTGYVLTPDCKPVAGAWLDFWQADDQGAYDNTGYRLRGHLFAAETGRYQLETIVPGEYSGRTQHIHVKVQAPNGPILTTQIYFPGAAGNDRDSIFDPTLLAEMQDTAEGKVATFNFVVKP